MIEWEQARPADGWEQLRPGVFKRTEPIDPDAARHLMDSRKALATLDEDGHAPRM